MRCPVCRAAVEQGPQCRRCRADLSLLFALEDRRRALLQEAGQALALGRWRRVVALASEAQALRRGEDGARLLALGHLAGKNFPEAWSAYNFQSRGSGMPGDG
jgi:hypothetical protein